MWISKFIAKFVFCTCNLSKVEWPFSHFIANFYTILNKLDLNHVITMRKYIAPCMSGYSQFIFENFLHYNQCIFIGKTIKIWLWEIDKWFGKFNNNWSSKVYGSFIFYTSFVLFLIGSWPITDYLFKCMNQHGCYIYFVLNFKMF